MTSELEVVQHADDVALAVGVGPRQKTEHANFVERLTSETVLTTDDLQCYPTMRLVIKRADDLTETATTEYFEHLVAVHADTHISIFIKSQTDTIIEKTTNKKLSCRREAARRSVSLTILLSLKIV